MTRHHHQHHHVPEHHAHTPTHHHHHAHHYAHHAPSLGTASKKAYHTVSRDIVKPFWQDIVRPTVKAVDDIPKEAFHSVDNTVDHVTNLFSNPFFLIAGSLIAVKVLTK